MDNKLIKDGRQSAKEEEIMKTEVQMEKTKEERIKKMEEERVKKTKEKVEKKDEEKEWKSDRKDEEMKMDRSEEEVCNSQKEKRDSSEESKSTYRAKECADEKYKNLHDGYDRTNGVRTGNTYSYLVKIAFLHDKRVKTNKYQQEGENQTS
jgi:hypothetical protein